MGALLPLLPFALVAGLATGCAADAVTGGADAPTETPTEAAPMADGEHFGFLTAVAANPATVTIDPATWVADDAEPNGYRIDDPGLDPVDLLLAADVEVLTSTGDPTTAKVVDVDELRAWFEGLAAPDETAPFDLVVADGEVVEMSFVYRP